MPLRLLNSLPIALMYIKTRSNVMANTLELALRVLMPIAAVVAGFFIYRASESMGGEIGSRFKILTLGTVFLALYGALTSIQDAGFTIFSYRDSAFGVIHLIIHLCFTVTTLVGMASIRKVTSGGDLE